MSRYWATSQDMVRVKNRKLKGTGFYMEFNPNIVSNNKKGMYRLNGEYLPEELMGYELYPSVLINRYRRYKKRLKDRD